MHLTDPLLTYFTFTFKKQNVKQTTHRNNSSNGWRTNPERDPETNKQHSNSFQKTTRVLFSFNSCTIQSQQIQDVYASKGRMVGRLLQCLQKWSLNEVPQPGELNKTKPRDVTKKNSVLIGSFDLSTTSGCILIWPKKYHWRNRITRKTSWKIWDFFCVAIKLRTALYPAALTGSRFRSSISLAVSVSTLNPSFNVGKL